VCQSVASAEKLTNHSSMLKLENINDVTMVNDGQEAYDMVKASMEKAMAFDLIFMDIQVRQDYITRPDHILTY
jgi:CheY-like chemotaxis protein